MTDNQTTAQLLAAYGMGILQAAKMLEAGGVLVPELGMAEQRALPLSADAPAQVPPEVGEVSPAGEVPAAEQVQAAGEAKPKGAKLPSLRINSWVQYAQGFDGVVKLVRQLALYMDERGLKAKDAAKLLGCSDATIYGWMKGKNNPKPLSDRRIRALIREGIKAAGETAPEPSVRGFKPAQVLMDLEACRRVLGMPRRTFSDVHLSCSNAWYDKLSRGKRPAGHVTLAKLEGDLVQVRAFMIRENFAVPEGIAPLLPEMSTSNGAEPEEELGAVIDAEDEPGVEPIPEFVKDKQTLLQRVRKIGART